ncbi:MAG: hypothetical protein M1491_08215 [Deltaproteobacteria bacterium]|nr:hypothetical protein [Deltaproteobacteria bacterium]MCL5278035.1 hypothetical protein [Deltaproteobacteria bacterium]
MQDEKRTSSSNGTGSTLMKDIGKSVASSALAGLILAVVSKGAVWVFPKLKL